MLPGTPWIRWSLEYITSLPEIIWILIVENVPAWQDFFFLTKVYYCNNRGLIVMAYPITAGQRGPHMMVWGERFCMNWWMKRLDWWVIKAKELLNPDQITWHFKWKQTWGHNSVEVERETVLFFFFFFFFISVTSFTIRNRMLIIGLLKSLNDVGNQMVLEKGSFYTSAV